MSSRNDAYKVYEIPPFKQIFPYIMPRRVDSLVYQNMVLDLTETLKFIKKTRAADGRQYRVFEVVLAAVVRTIALRPELNRFIANYQYWQRKELSVNFVVKEDYTDEAPEHSMPLYFEAEMTLDEIAAIINEAIITQRVIESTNLTDDAILFFLKLPRFLIRFIFSWWRSGSKYGKLPQMLRDADGLHTSVFVSNLGSIGLGGGSPHHHLYEWGTTSLFMTMGLLKRSRYMKGEQSLTRDTMEIGLTIDERISDGFYLARSFKVLQDLLSNPHLLTERPILPPPPLTKRQYKKKRKALRSTTR